MVDHYYSKESNSKFVPCEFEYEFNSKKLRFISGSGVFCIGSVDYCSEVLINYCDVSDGKNILDLGCGFGPIGICLLTKFKNLHCDFTDVNERASNLTRKNLQKNKIEKERCKVFCGEGYEKLIDEKGKNKLYDVILLNPPQSAGRKLCNKLIEDAKEHLKEGGSIQIVARHNKGGAMFEKFMMEIYKNCETLKKRSGVRVYKSVLI
jgi:16S rRNA (guanine1207-N2)-methyltransferase